MKGLISKEILNPEPKIYTHNTEKYSYIIEVIFPFWESPEYEGCVSFWIKNPKGETLFSRRTGGSTSEFILTSFKTITNFLEGKDSIVLFDEDPEGAIIVKRNKDDLELTSIDRIHQ